MELIAVVIVLIVIISMLIPTGPSSRLKGERIACVNNLKQIGTAYRIWANDHGDEYPFAASRTNGGWGELLNSRAGANCWTNYMVMKDELGTSPRSLTCPSDERKPVASLSEITNNDSVSYFVGIQASDHLPQSILAGDRNLGPGMDPDKDFGFSLPDGFGNDVIVRDPSCWSLKMHSSANSTGAGNILLGDGSSQQVTSRALTQNWLKPAIEELRTSTGATNLQGIRLVFP